MHRKFGAHECEVKIELYRTNQPPSPPTLQAQSSDTALGSKPPTPISGDVKLTEENDVHPPTTSTYTRRFR